MIEDTEINPFKIGQNTPCFIIAEAGVNHNGSIQMALRLVDAAADAGADAVKFQTFKSEKLVSKQASKADYQKQNTDGSESQLEMLKRLELDETAHKKIIAHCNKKNIHFLSTPFDSDSLNLLAYKLGLPIVKIPSGEITNLPFLLAVARTGKPIIMSTGMATLSEVEAALEVLAFGYTADQNDTPSLDAFQHAYSSIVGQNALQQKVTLLHCTTDYPAVLDQVNLRAMDTIRSAFQLPVGYSDHTAGISVPIAAVARGAKVIEKHLTLDRTLPGPDHRASLEPDGFKKMVESIRQIELAIGSPQKIPTNAELKNKPTVRKSLVALTPIKPGDRFTEKNIGTKRPGDGISPAHFWKYIGKISDQSYAPDEKIKPAN